MHPTPNNTERASAEQVRLRARKSRNWVAAVANVSPQTVRIFEISPDQVRDADKRQALEELYDKLRGGAGAVQLQQDELRRAAGV
jgi:hypothetical protein